MKSTTFWQAVSGILAVLIVISIATHGFGLGKKAGATGAAVGDLGNLDLKGKAIILSDARCAECNTSPLKASLEQALPGIKFAEFDYSSEEGKKLYNDNGLKFLPAVFFDDSITNNPGYAAIQQYLDKQGSYLFLRIGAEFDPAAEICDNGIDDNGDKLVDCNDKSCSTNWKCMPKKDVVDVDLFVMSYCPFGTQMEKGILPVVDLLGNKVNFNVRFVYYAMHGQTEIDEEMLQYCIQKDFSKKYLEYLRCFLKDGKSDACLSQLGLTGKMDSCIKETDEKFKITKSYNNKSAWVGNYPPFDIDKALNEKYDVGGSPTLVINGVVASSARDPASLLNAVCTGFKSKPDACNKKLASEIPSPGFGEGTSAAAATGSCT